MNPLFLIYKEMRHRGANTVLSVIAVGVAVTLFVSLAMTQEAQERETRRITRDLGFNVRIIPKDADESAFHLNGWTTHTMPEDSVRRLAGHADLSYNHLLATLSRRIEVEGQGALLVGLSGELSPPGKKKKPMIFSVKPGHVHVGATLGRTLKLKKGAALELLGERFTVTRVMPEAGTRDDVTIFGHLADVQRVLNLEGRISEIKAIDCLCLTADKDPVKQLRKELDAYLPEAKVFHLSKMADKRARQRALTEGTTRFVIPLLVLVCAAWLGILAWLNVRARRAEIGVLRALGYGSGFIGSLFLGRALLIGLLGSFMGFAGGTWLALDAGPDLFQLTAKAIKPDPRWLLLSLAGAPVFAALAALLPTLNAVAQDPAAVLRET